MHPFGHNILLRVSLSSKHENAVVKLGARQVCQDARAHHFTFHMRARKRRAQSQDRTRPFALRAQLTKANKGCTMQEPCGTHVYDALYKI